MQPAVDVTGVLPEEPVAGLFTHMLRAEAAAAPAARARVPLGSAPVPVPSPRGCSVSAAEGGRTDPPSSAGGDAPGRYSPRFPADNCTANPACLQLLRVYFKKHMKLLCGVTHSIAVPLMQLNIKCICHKGISQGLHFPFFFFFPQKYNSVNACRWFLSDSPQLSVHAILFRSSHR